MTNITKN